MKIFLGVVALFAVALAKIVKNMAPIQQEASPNHLECTAASASLTCHNMEAHGAWESEAGSVCISITDSSIMTVKFDTAS